MLFRRIKEPPLWIKAEEEFYRWIDNPSDYQHNEHSDLRKSLHIYFRKKFQKLLEIYTLWIYDKLMIHKLLDKEAEAEYNYYNPVEFITSKELKSSYEIEPFGTIYPRTIRISESNQNFIESFWDNDQVAIEKFYSKAFSKVAWLILKNNGTIEDAKDIFQDAMVIMMEKFIWDNLDLNCALETYVYSISRNLWHEHLRTRGKEKKFIDLEQYKTVGVSIDYYKEKEPDFLNQIIKAMESLGDSCKKLLELYYFWNYSWKSIASCLGYRNAASARNQKYKCLRRLRDLLLLEE
jgi:RNA polymerase sigma factor (sigma-70 family)